MNPSMFDLVHNKLTHMGVFLKSMSMWVQLITHKFKERFSYVCF